MSLLVLAGLVNYLDRSSLAIANRPIRSELHLSGTQMGLLLSAFSLAYGLAQLPLGPIIDRAGARPLLRAGVAVWSLAQILTGWVTGLRSFVPLRILLGAGEAPFFPASVKLIREDFEGERRGRAMAAVNMSSIVGQALAPPLLTLVMLRVGWRAMFALLGFVGLLLSAIWSLLDRRSQGPGGIARSADCAIESRPLSLLQWTSLFQSRSIWGLMLGFGGLNYTVSFYMGWLPAYLQSDRGLTVSSSGWLAAIPFVAGAVGMFASGALADRADRRGASMSTVHRRQIIFGMLASAVATAAAGVARSPGIALACISAALFFIHFAGTSAWGFLQAASAPRSLATLSSIQNAGAFVVASASSILTGWQLDKTHSFETAFLLCACAAAVGAAIYFLLVRIPLNLPSS